MKELFPLKTFHQDAILKRLSELYENEKDLDGRIEDLEDLELPTPAVGDSGKVLQVGADGKYGLGTVSGGTKLCKHRLKMQYQSTIVTLILYTNNKEKIDNLTKLYDALWGMIYGYEISDSGTTFMSLLIPNTNINPFIIFSYFSSTYPGGNIDINRKVLNLTTMEYNTTQRTISSSYTFTDTVTEL